MKRRILAFILTLALVVGVVGVPSQDALAAVTFPDTVRVGLYFKGHYSGNGPVSSMKVSNSSGVMLAIAMGSQVMELGPRYDKYVVCEKMVNTYHVAVATAYDTYASAVLMQQTLVDMGLSSYIVYTGTWNIWSGNFSSKADAEVAVQQMIDLGLTASVVSPSATRIGCYNNNQLTFVFDLSGTGLLVCPTSSGYLTLNDTASKTYRGNIEFRRFSDSDMTVVNVVPFEQYLYGVVPNEIGATAPTEALKAQAVAARTFTVKTGMKYPKYNFHVSDTVQDQVYKGINYESTACNNAVNATAGQIIWYNNEPAETYYFSCANGFTENPKYAFGGAELDYLKSVDSTFESKSSYLYTWTITYSAATLKAQLLSYGVNIGDITEVKINKVTNAGRVYSMTFVGTNGSKTYTNSDCRFKMDLYSQQFTVEVGNGDGTATLYYPITAEAGNSITTKDPVSSAVKTNRSFIRTITYTNLQMAINGKLKEIDGTNLKFANINPAPFTGHYLHDYVGFPGNNNNTVVDSFFKTELPYSGEVGCKTVVSTLAKGQVRFSGKGWGHAVGMSQDGAIALGNKGYSYVEILEHYYSGATVK